MVKDSNRQTYKINEQGTSFRLSSFGATNSLDAQILVGRFICLKQQEPGYR
jgi:hypothetical protein